MMCEVQIRLADDGRRSVRSILGRRWPEALSLHKNADTFHATAWSLGADDPDGAALCALSPDWVELRGEPDRKQTIN
jgi:hypothetical protein